MSSSPVTLSSSKAEAQSPTSSLQPSCVINEPSTPVFHPQNNLPFSPIHPISSPIGSTGLSLHEYEDKENTTEVDRQAQYCSTPSPRGFQYDGNNDDIRLNLLMQRAFNAQEECASHLTSSPMRKAAVINFMSSPGRTPNNLLVPRSASKEYGADSHYNGSTPQSLFKTPVRGQYSHRGDHPLDRTPSAPRTPGFMSPASSLYGYTPGRQFVNPFEVDHERLHMPVITPSMFQVKSRDVESSAERDSFWTIEQRALMMPIEIKDSEVRRQHFHQKRRDKEMDPLVQLAIDQYFANELVVPSPWSEKVPRNVPQTPSSASCLKSVSCQTAMSVPPDADLITDIGEKYQLPDDSQLVHESPVDYLGNSFIRRKLLHQLNENSQEGGIMGSPELPQRSHTAQNPTAVSPSPPKQVTPEAGELRTPRRKNSGHFSSSPIKQSGEKGQQAMSESDILASPELSPIAGRVSNKPLRSSDVFSSHNEFERSREIMQLDFSSILDEPDELDNVNLTDKSGTLLNIRGTSSPSNTSSGFPDQNTHTSCQPSQNVREENETQQSSINKSLNAQQRSMLVSGLSAESTQDAVTNIPNLLSSQDTGYQTASIQSITNLDLNTQPDNDSCALSANHTFNGTNSHTRATLVPSSSSLNFDHPIGGLPFRSGLCMEGEGNSLDSYLCSGSRLQSSFYDKNNNSDCSYSTKSRHGCRIRKFRTLSDIRRSKEKSNASRDLTSSFNEEAKSSTIVVRLSRSLSNPSVDLESSLSSSVSVVLPNSAYESKVESVSGRVSQTVSKEKMRPGLFLEDAAANLNRVKSETVGNQHSFARGASCIEKRPFENIGNRPDNELTEVEIERKQIKLLDDKGDKKESCDDDVVLFAATSLPPTTFSLEDKRTLDEARELLGKSEALRMQHDNDDSKTDLEMDTFFQYISDNRVTNITRSDFAGRTVLENSNIPQTTLSEGLKLHPIRMSSPDSVTLDNFANRVDLMTDIKSGVVIDNVEERGNLTETVKSGSELAAEILKRAGDDLAQFTSF